MALPSQVLTEDQKELFEDLAEELDVPATKYEQAKQHYEGVGKWLGADGSALASMAPKVYVQGSFLLGTAVSPVHEDQDYDIDLVCELDTSPAKYTHRRLKQLVGNRIYESETYRPLLQPEKRRCWTIRYAKSLRFHLDVLPAIPRPAYVAPTSGIPPSWDKSALWITDKTLAENVAIWPSSNPIGYAEWFRRRMYQVFMARKRLLAEARKASVEAVPDYEVRTPLQRVVQLLKRHRDLRFEGDPDRPISVIITTLAATAYGSEESVGECLVNIVPRFASLFENRAGTLWLPCPVAPSENLADRWTTEPRKRERFFEWLKLVESDVAAFRSGRSIGEQERALGTAFGKSSATGAVQRFRTKHDRGMVSRATSGLGGALVRAAESVNRAVAYAIRLVAPHRQEPTWEPDLRYTAVINGTATRDGFRTVQFSGTEVRLSRGYSLNFEVHTDAPEPYEVYWQVVNTGDEARGLGGLRGSLFPGTGRQKESTMYVGRHWIEAFIVRDGRCVARTREFYVVVE